MVLRRNVLLTPNLPPTKTREALERKVSETPDSLPDFLKDIDRRAQKDWEKMEREREKELAKLKKEQQKLLDQQRKEEEKKQKREEEKNKKKKKMHDEMLKKRLVNSGALVTPMGRAPPPSVVRTPPNRRGPKRRPKSALPERNALNRSPTSSRRGKPGSAILGAPSEPTSSGSPQLPRARSSSSDQKKANASLPKAGHSKSHILRPGRR